MRFTTTKYLAFTAVLDNSALGTEQLFYFTLPHNRSQQAEVSSAPLPGSRDSIINWISQADYQRVFGYYKATPSEIYVRPTYACVQLNAARQVYRPRLTNVTSTTKAATPTGQLSHSNDGIGIQFFPRWEKETWYDNVTSQLNDTNSLRKLTVKQMDRRQNRAFVMRWRNRDPAFKWKIIPPNYWTQGGAYPVDPSQLVLPYSTQWYADFEAATTTWAQDTIGNVEKTPGAYATAIPTTNFKYANSQPCICIRMPPNTAAQLQIDCDRTLYWKGLTNQPASQVW